jgi:L-cysteine/cystine lyase
VALSERVLEQAQPTLIGWRSLRHESAASSSFHRDARRFEVATSCVPLCSGLATSLELLAQAGTPTDRIEQIRAGSRQLWQGLQPIQGIRTLLSEPPPAGLVSFTLEGQPSSAVVERLGAQGIWIRRLDDPDCLRACTHITTTDLEITALLDALIALA